MTKPELTERMLLEHLNRFDLDRGHAIVQRGGVQYALLYDETLRAQCIGSAPTPYRLEITIERGRISSNCSCPVRTKCKHVAALLLTYLHHPERVTDVAELRAKLESRPQAELVTLLLDILNTYPQGLELLEASLEGVLSPASIARQVEAAYCLAPDPEAYHAIRAVLPALSPIVKRGDSYLLKGDLENAMTIYSSFITEVEARRGMVNDRYSETNEFLLLAAEGLASCMSATDDVELRERALELLFFLYRKHLGRGGELSSSIAGLLKEYPNPQERAALTLWLEALIPEVDKWEAKEVGSLLMWVKDGLDDEAYLRLCRETGRTDDLVTRLLELRRFPEARKEVQGVTDYALLRLAGLFAKHGYSKEAYALVKDRSHTSTDNRLLEWLRTQAEARGDMQEVLTLSESLFRAAPSFSEYERLKKVATTLRTWDSLHGKLLKHLQMQHLYPLLAEIHLNEGRALEALRTLEGVTNYPNDLLQDITEALEGEHPQEAIPLRLKEIERLVLDRNRESFREAARRLLKLRDLYRRTGQQEAWNSLITDLKKRNKTRKALLEEWQREGL